MPEQTGVEVLAALLAEGRAKLAAAVAEDKQPVVLKAEGEVDATTDLLIWAGNNMPNLLDALESLSARVAELGARGEPIGYVIVTEVEGRGPFIHGDHRQVMSSTEAIESVGRSDLPRGVRHLLCTVQEATR